MSGAQRQYPRIEEKREIGVCIYCNGGVVWFVPVVIMLVGAFQVLAMSKPERMLKSQPTSFKTIRVQLTEKKMAKKVSCLFPFDQDFLRYGNFKSIDELRKRLESFIEYYKRTMAKVFKWTYKGKLLQA